MNLFATSRGGLEKLREREESMDGGRSDNLRGEQQSWVFNSTGSTPTDT